MRKRHLAATILVIFSGLGVISAEANGPARRDGLTIGIVKTLFHNVTATQFQVMAATFQTVLESQTGLKGQLIEGGTYDEIRQKLADGSIQLGVVHGIEYAWMKLKQPDLEPMVLNMIDPNALRAVVLVSKNSPAKDLDDLRGQKLAMVKTAREDTRLFLKRLCRESGTSVEEFFSERTTPPTVEDMLDSLVDGKIDAGLLEQSGYMMFQRRKPARAAQLRVLEQSEHFPPSVIVYRRDKIDKNTIQSFRAGMGAAHESMLGGHLMMLMNVKKFETPTSEYSKRLTEALKNYPLTSESSVEAPVRRN